ncbi:MAG: hypothetical protein HHJ12_11255 [Glaciimonas sp.]|nr:hypothetical protein [Glaciimonas sp.]
MAFCFFSLAQYSHNLYYVKCEKKISPNARNICTDQTVAFGPYTATDNTLKNPIFHDSVCLPFAGIFFELQFVDNAVDAPLAPILRHVNSVYANTNYEYEKKLNYDSHYSRNPKEIIQSALTNVTHHVN